ncbi:hypothetical protein N2152v2_005850 [Parachlorella kessleri]
MDTDSDEFEVIDREEIEQAAVDLRQDWPRSSVFSGLLPWASQAVGTNKVLPANQRPSPLDSPSLLTTTPGASPAPTATGAAAPACHLPEAPASAGVVSFPRPAPPRTDSSASLELFPPSQAFTATPSAASLHAHSQLPLSPSDSVARHLERSGLAAPRLPAISSTSSLCSGISACSACSASSCEFCAPLPAAAVGPPPLAHGSTAGSRRSLGSLSTPASSSGGLADLLLAEAEVSPATSERSLRISHRPDHAPQPPSTLTDAAQSDMRPTESSSSVALAATCSASEGESAAGVMGSSAGPFQQAAPLGGMMGHVAAAADVIEAAAPPAEVLSREAREEGIDTFPTSPPFQQQPALGAAPAATAASTTLGGARHPAGTSQAAQGDSSQPPATTSMLQGQAKALEASRQQLQQQTRSAPSLVAAAAPGVLARPPVAASPACPSATQPAGIPGEAALAAAASAAALPSLPPSPPQGGLRSGGRQRRPAAHRAPRPLAAPSVAPHHPHLSALAISGSVAAAPRPPPPPPPSSPPAWEAGLDPQHPGAFNSSRCSAPGSTPLHPPWTSPAPLGAVLSLLRSTLERRLRTSRALLTLLAVAAMALMLGAGALGGVRAAKHLGGSEAAELRLQQGGGLFGAARMLGQVGDAGGGGSSTAESWPPALARQKHKEGRLVVVAPVAAGDLSPWGLEGQAPGGMWREDEQVLLGRQKGWVSAGAAPAVKV